jgi:hypothetical protein
LEHNLSKKVNTELKQLSFPETLEQRRRNQIILNLVSKIKVYSVSIPEIYAVLNHKSLIPFVQIVASIFLTVQCFRVTDRLLFLGLLYFPICDEDEQHAAQ